MGSTRRGALYPGTQSASLPVSPVMAVSVDASAQGPGAKHPHPPSTAVAGVATRPSRPSPQKTAAVQSGSAARLAAGGRTCSPSSCLGLPRPASACLCLGLGPWAVLGRRATNPSHPLPPLVCLPALSNLLTPPPCLSIVIYVLDLLNPRSFYF